MYWCMYSLSRTKSLNDWFIFIDSIVLLSSVLIHVNLMCLFQLILCLLIFSRAIKIEWTIPEETTISNPLEHLSNVQFQISNYTVLVFSMIQIVYILNFIMKEYRVTSTFYWQSEGVGYLQLVSSALYPFYFTSISKHVSDTGLMLSTNVLVIASLLFMLGFGLMLISNDIKYEFRRDPLQASLASKYAFYYDNYSSSFDA